MASTDFERTDVPLFARDGGDDIIDKRRKELEVFLKCWHRGSPICGKTLIALMPDKYEKETVDWWQNRYTTIALLEFLETKKKVNGKEWSCGFMGSRWADVTLNGKSIRLAFYSRKGDTKTFEKLKPEYDYAIFAMV